MLSREEKRVLLEIAREAIQEELLGTQTKRVPPEGLQLVSKRGLFVTLTKGGELRGCIGRVESRDPLFRLVAEMARAAALDDPRFSPLTVAELPKIEIEISVLSPLEPLEDVKTIEIGRDGLMVRRGFASGLLLPQVASNHRWSREEFLSQVCIKAGPGREAWREKRTEFFSFTAEVFSEKDV